MTIEAFFNASFQGYDNPSDPNSNGGLMDNDCFIQAEWVNQSDCDTYNPPERLSDFQNIEKWMRSPQCVSTSNKCLEMTGNPWGYVSVIAPTRLTRTIADNIFVEGVFESDTGSRNSNFTPALPSCCGLCDLWAQNVDLYYWPEPDANLSCTSTIGESFRALDHGATTRMDSYSTNSGWKSSTCLLWGCDVTDIFPIEGKPGEVTTSVDFTTTAKITTVGSLAIRIFSYSP